MYFYTKMRKVVKKHHAIDPTVYFKALPRIMYTTEGKGTKSKIRLDKEQRKTLQRDSFKVLWWLVLDGSCAYSRVHHGAYLANRHCPSIRDKRTSLLFFSSKSKELLAQDHRLNNLGRCHQFYLPFISLAFIIFKLSH